MPRQEWTTLALMPSICRFIEAYAFILPVLAAEAIIPLQAMLLSLCDTVLTHDFIPATNTGHITNMINGLISNNPSATPQLQACLLASRFCVLRTPHPASAAFLALCRHAREHLSTQPTPGLAAFLGLFGPEPRAELFASAAADRSNTNRPLCVRAPEPVAPDARQSLLSLRFPSHLDAPSLINIAKGVATVLATLPSHFSPDIAYALARGPVDALLTLIEDTRSWLQSALPVTYRDFLHSIVLHRATALLLPFPPLFFAARPPNLDPATGITTSALGTFEEDGTSIRAPALRLHQLLWPALHALIDLCPALMAHVPQHVDLNTVEAALHAETRFHARSLPPGLAPPCAASHQPSGPALPRLVSIISDCMRASLATADTALATTVPQVVAKAQQLFCCTHTQNQTSESSRILFSGPLSVITAAVEVFGSRPNTHDFFARVVPAVIHHTHNALFSLSHPLFTRPAPDASPPLPPHVLSHAANNLPYHSEAVTDLLTLFRSLLRVRPPRATNPAESWTSGPNFNLYGPMWLLESAVLPSLLNILAIAITAAPTDRDIARVTLDVASAFGAAACMELQAHRVFTQTFLDRVTTTPAEMPGVPARFLGYAYDEEQWNYNAARFACNPNQRVERGLFWYHKGAPNAAAVAAAGFVRAVMAGLAGQPEIPQEMLNGAASALLGILASAPAALAAEWVSAAVTNPSFPATHLAEDTRRFICELFVQRSTMVAEGDVHREERKYRMMVRDVAAVLRSPSVDPKVLEDHKP
jgi:hypothetical protein